MFQTKVVEKIKTQILFSIFFYHAIYEMWKIFYSAAQKITIWCMCIVCWITKATSTYEYCLFTATMITPQCYITRKLPLLLMFVMYYILIVM